MRVERLMARRLRIGLNQRRRKVHEAKRKMGDRQFVSRLQHTGVDPFAIDPRSVCAPEVPYQHAVAFEHQATVTPRNSERLESHITALVTADQARAAAQKDVRLAAQ
jgi:hypothetical protein